MGSSTFTHKKFTQIVTSGAATIGVLAGVGMTTVPAKAITLGECIATNCTITARDKIFSEWSLSSEVGVDPFNIEITPLTDGGNNPGPGLMYTFLNNELSLSSTGTEQIVFGYRVDVIGGQRIKDNSLLFDATATGSNSSAEVHEFVFEDAARTIPALGTHNLPGLTNEKDVLLVVDDDEVSVDNPTDFIDFQKRYETLYVFKEFSVDVSGPTGTASITNVKQRFSQTSPEPASTLGLLALGSLGVALKRKKES